MEDFGAIADSLTINTTAIQKTIDACTAAGGGMVVFSKGNYVTGTIELKSNVILKVKKKARILGSIDLSDYPEKIESLVSVMSETHEFRQSLIYAEKATNVGITGKGEIYFRGESKNFNSPETLGKIDGRPFGIRMIQCNNIVLTNVSLKNSAAWMQDYLDCDNLLFDGIKVVNQGNHNNDGLDID